eukprot:768628-Hanusia_phi.AAC.7
MVTAKGLSETPKGGDSRYPSPSGSHSELLSSTVATSLVTPSPPTAREYQPNRRPLDIPRMEQEARSGVAALLVRAYPSSRPCMVTLRNALSPAPTVAPTATPATCSSSTGGRQMLGYRKAVLPAHRWMRTETAARTSSLPPPPWPSAVWFHRSRSDLPARRVKGGVEKET